MGNVCGKTEIPTDERSALPSHSIPSIVTQKAIPKKAVSGASRTFQYGPGNTVGSTVTGGDLKDAKQKAAEAAEARAAASSQLQKGKLASQLHKQKKQSRAAVLDDMSREVLKVRALDENREAQKYK